MPDTGVGEKYDQYKQKKEEVKQDAQAEAQDQAERTRQRAEYENVDPNNTQQQKYLAKDEGSNVANRAQNVVDKHVPQDRQEQARVVPQQMYNENKEATKDYFREKFPEERRDKFIYRLKSEWWQ